MNLIDCTTIPEKLNDCTLGLKARPSGAIDPFDDYLRILWGLSRYQNSLTAAQILQIIDISKGDEETNLQRKELTDYLKDQSSNILPSDTDFYLFWHILKGHYISTLNKFGVGHAFKARYTCFDELDCQEASEAFSKMSQEIWAEIENAMDQPLVHGDLITDFILIPLCNFGTEITETCNIFKKTETQFEDQTCFTFDEGIKSQIGPENGLNLVLNLQMMPKEKPLELKLFLHEPGTVPDVLNLESSNEVLNENQWTKIGIGITSNEATDNFLAMSNEKRHCTFGQNETYQRTKCLVTLVHEYAMKFCNCSPRKFESQNYQKCNISGSHCFRNAIGQVCR